MLSLLFHTIDILPNHKGLLYKNNVLTDILEPGRYFYMRVPYALFTYINVPVAKQLVTVANQEVLTADMISLRFSYTIDYTIHDAKAFAARFTLFHGQNQPVYPTFEAQQYLHTESQHVLRLLIAAMQSQELNTKRDELVEKGTKALQEVVNGTGITVKRVAVKDILFPKAIQDVFASQLEAKVRAVAELENARTQVATTRALLNAAALMNDHPGIEYLQWLETLKSVSKKGNHTFVIGEKPEALPFSSTISMAKPKRK